MFADVTDRLYATVGCRWKLDSLKLMPNEWACLEDVALRGSEITFQACTLAMPDKAIPEPSVAGTTLSVTALG